MPHAMELATSAPAPGMMKAVMAAVAGQASDVKDLVLKALHMGMNNPIRTSPTVFLPPEVFNQLVQQGILASSGDGAIIAAAGGASPLFLPKSAPDQ